MGTVYNISLVVNSGAIVELPVLKKVIDEALQDVEAAMSTYRPDSELSLFNQAPAGSEVGVSASTRLVFAEALRLNELTEGAFDATVAPLIDLWGFGGGSKTRNLLVPEERIRQALDRVGMDRVQLRSNRLLKTSDVTMDFSAIAKGFAVDQIAQILDSKGITRYLVEIGGEVVTRGKSIRNTSWVLGIESPDKSGRSVYTMAHLDDAALATSGDYRNFFEVDGKKYSHTIDPRTGRPVEHSLSSVSVIAESCMLADGLATALMVMGEDKGLKFAEKHKISALFIYRDGDRLATKHTKYFEKYLR